MPIDVIGSTDTSNALPVSMGRAKSICLICKAGSDSTGPESTLLPIFSMGDATKKIGNNTTALDMIKVFIRNRVSQIYVMIAPMDSETEPKPMYKETLKLSLQHSIDIVMIDSAIQTDLLLLKDHLDEAELEDKYRYTVGSISTTTNEEVLSYQELVNHSRVFIPIPELTDIDTALPVGPQVTSAALASLIATETVDPALPMNGVEPKGFGGVSRILSKTELNTMVDNGITPFTAQGLGDTATVYRLVTSYTKDGVELDPTWQEGTTRFIADDVLDSVRKRILKKYKRSKNVARLLDAMKTDVIDVLGIKEGLEIIENLDPSTVSVVKDPDDLYGALIDYEFDVVTPLYTVKIKQHMVL